MSFRNETESSELDHISNLDVSQLLVSCHHKIDQGLLSFFRDTKEQKSRKTTKNKPTANQKLIGQ